MAVYVRGRVHFFSSVHYGACVAVCKDPCSNLKQKYIGSVELVSYQ